MNIYNYLRVLGAFTNSHQPISLPAEPTDRQERKMLDEAQKQVSLAWSRREQSLLAYQEKSGRDIDFEAEKKAFLPEYQDGKVLIRLQFLQDYMLRRIAGVQTSASIHSKDQVKELKDVFNEYGVKLRTSFSGVVLDDIRWADRAGQKPKVLIHISKGDRRACIRLEAVAELAQKFLNAVADLGLVQGSVFDLRVAAEDPAVERNKRAGKKVMEPGRYVNHNLWLTSDGHMHDGRPPKGVRFLQKPTLEQMERLFHQVVQANMNPEQQRKAA